MKFCTELGDTPLLAVKTSGKLPATVGVPARAPVAALKLTPAGRAPVCDNVGVGEPVAVTVKLPSVPTLNVAALALVISGAVPEGATGFTNWPTVPELASSVPATPP